MISGPEGDDGAIFFFQKLNMYGGMFHIFVRDWLKVFPREQIFIYRLEDYSAHMDEYLQKIYQHVGLSE